MGVQGPRSSGQGLTCPIQSETGKQTPRTTPTRGKQENQDN